MKKGKGAAAWLAALSLCCAAVLLAGAFVRHLPQKPARLALRPVKERAAPTPPAGLWINRATKEELMRLKGMGPKLADRVIAHREQQPFYFPEDIAAVPGIGDKRLKEWMPYLIQP